MRRSLAVGPVMLAGISLGVSGCALNAALEVEMELPYEAGDAPRARVDVCHEGCVFDGVWGQEHLVFDLEPEVAECETGGSCNVRFSVLTEKTEIERLQVRVRFCDDDCDLDGAPPGASELWYELQDPFLRGRRTYWNPSAAPFVRVPGAQPTGPPEVSYVPRCEIRDECWPEELAPDPENGYCDGEGLRFCETGLSPAP